MTHLRNLKAVGYVGPCRYMVGVLWLSTLANLATCLASTAIILFSDIEVLKVSVAEHCHCFMQI